MSGLGTTGPIRVYAVVCSLSVGLYEWRVQWIKRFVKPTAKQTPPLNEPMAASAKARKTIAAACQKEPVVTSTVQLSVMEKRAFAMMEPLEGPLARLRESIRITCVSSAGLPECVGTRAPRLAMVIKPAEQLSPAALFN